VIRSFKKKDPKEGRTENDGISRHTALGSHAVEKNLHLSYSERSRSEWPKNMSLSREKENGQRVTGWIVDSWPEED